ncbi:MAG TPA: hypothetical protein VGG88_11650 [Gaiellaceae bacterium]
MGRRLQLAAAAAATFVLLAAPAARADGDPASDVLPAADVFASSRAPVLAAAVAAANRGGNRIKVAVIARRSDLGSVPVLFGKPAAYARFLGIELGTLYRGVLLVVMPSGFGVYDAGRPVAAEERALAGLGTATGADGLAHSAAAAVERLAAAKTLHYTDVLPPLVYAIGGPGLQYAVADDSGRAAVTVTVFAGKRVLGVIRRPLATVNPSAVYTAKWRRPAGAPAKLRYCVTAVDGAGNRSRPACIALPNR